MSNRPSSIEKRKSEATTCFVITVFLENLHKLVSLESLDLRGNQIANLADISDLANVSLSPPRPALFTLLRYDLSLDYCVNMVLAEDVNFVQSERSGR